MSARRSDALFPDISARNGVTAHKGQTSRKDPHSDDQGLQVSVREIFDNISRTNRQKSGPTALVSRSVQGHDGLAVNSVVDYS